MRVISQSSARSVKYPRPALQTRSNMRHYDDQLDTYSANPVSVSRIDVPFFDLVWLFLKSSLALALAFTLTSWLWVLIGTGVLTLTALSLWLLGVPRLLEVPPPAGAPVAVVAPAPPP